MGLDERISRLEQRMGLAAGDDDLVILVYDTEGMDGPIRPGQEPAMTIRYTATGEKITTYGPDWTGYGPATKLYSGFDPDAVGRAAPAGA
jgi:hypothetical protein